MEQLTNILSEVFDAKLSSDFVKRAVYYPSMDFVEYVASDTVCVSDRIDEFLTIIRDASQENVIGFKLKGFRYIFETQLKTLPEINDADFLPMVNAIEAILTTIGNVLLECHAPESEKRRKGYEQAKELAMRDNVKLDDFQKIAA